MAARCLVLAFLLLSAAAGAETVRLVLPVACTPGTDCWVAVHVDHAPAGAAQDYACGALAYDGHDGTDFAIRDRLAMAEGVAVLAAAPGTVRRVRDGMADGEALADPAAVAGRECGNGLVVEHAGNLQTQYCHLRRASLLVAEGDRVEAGRPIGLVGMSGAASFPHLHLTVRRDGRVVDPFVGPGERGACGLGVEPLWRDDALAALAYRPLILTDGGFAPAAPDLAGIEAGHFRASALPRTAPALVLWAAGYALHAGDELRFRITGPDGAVLLEHAETRASGQFRAAAWAGIRRPGAAWPAGRYLGEVELRRGDERARLERAIELR